MLIYNITIHAHAKRRGHLIADHVSDNSYRRCRHNLENMSTTGVDAIHTVAVALLEYYTRELIVHRCLLIELHHPLFIFAFAEK